MKLESCRNHCAEEIETIITMTGNGQDGFRVYTCNTPVVNKIGKFLDDKNSPWSIDRIEYNKDGTPSGYFFKCSVKNCLSLKAKKAAGRELSDEEKEIARERMKKMAAERKLKNRF